MSGGYTPGPWKPSMPLKAWDGTYSLFEIHWSDEGECVAEVVHGEANARLIAAAPELLDALREVLDTSGARGKYHSLKYAEAVDAAEALIARIEGESA